MEKWGPLYFEKIITNYAILDTSRVRGFLAQFNFANKKWGPLYRVTHKKKHWKGNGGIFSKNNNKSSLGPLDFVRIDDAPKRVTYRTGPNKMWVRNSFQALHRLYNQP